MRIGISWNDVEQAGETVVNTLTPTEEQKATYQEYRGDVSEEEAAAMDTADEVLATINSQTPTEQGPGGLREDPAYRTPVVLYGLSLAEDIAYGNPQAAVTSPKLLSDSNFRDNVSKIRNLEANEPTDAAFPPRKVTLEDIIMLAWSAYRALPPAKIIILAAARQLLQCPQYQLLWGDPEDPANPQFTDWSVNHRETMAKAYREARDAVWSALHRNQMSTRPGMVDLKSLQRQLAQAQTDMAQVQAFNSSPAVTASGGYWPPAWMSPKGSLEKDQYTRREGLPNTAWVHMYWEGMGPIVSRARHRVPSPAYAWLWWLNNQGGVGDGYDPASPWGALLWDDPAKLKVYAETLLDGESYATGVPVIDWNRAYGDGFGGEMQRTLRWWLTRANRNIGLPDDDGSPFVETPPEDAGPEPTPGPSPESDGNEQHQEQEQAILTSGGDESAGGGIGVGLLILLGAWALSQ